MSTIKSSTDHLTLNADGVSKDIKFQANGTEKMVLKSDGKLGVGTASPGNTLVVNHSGGGVLDVTRDSSSGYIRLSTDGTLGTIKNGGGALTFKTGGDTERLRILSGGGITFNGDTATANALDDYEEGTWTPTCSGGATSAYGSYTKIGRYVYCEGSLTFPNQTNSGGIQIESVPFSAEGSNTSRPTGTIRYTTYDSKMMLLDGWGNYINVKQMTFGSGLSPVNWTQISLKRIDFCYSFMTA